MPDALNARFKGLAGHPANNYLLSMGYVLRIACRENYELTIQEYCIILYVAVLKEGGIQRSEQLVSEH